MAHTPTFDYLEMACDGRRATLTLNRPERLNALSAAVMAEVVAAVAAAGYAYVTLDLEGLRSGNLNQALDGG